MMTSNRSSGRTSPESWTAAELLDLEYFLHAGEGQNPDALRARNRQDGQVASAAGVALDDRRPALRWWVDRRRAEWGGRVDTPGQFLAAALNQAGRLLAAAGGLLGVGAVAALLRHEVAHPVVNVAWFFLALIVPQLLLLGLLAGCLVWHPRRAEYRPRGLGHVVLALWEKIACWAWPRMVAHFPPERRGQAGEMLAVLRRQSQLYGGVHRWSLLRRVQAFGLGFNTGALLTLLAYVVFTDLGFGWQTTLDPDPGQVHRLVRFVASPWSWWLGEGRGYPGLAAIQGSRIIQQGGAAGPAEHLRAWWSFLFLCVATYGLLPRLAAWTLCWHWTRRELNALDFQDAAADTTWRQMREPLLEVGGESPARPAGATSPPPPSPPAGPADPAVAGTALVLWVPVDLQEWAADGAGPLPRLVSAQGGCPAAAVQTYGQSPRRDAEALAALPPGRPGAIVMEGWRPPVTESLTLLRDFRRHLGDKQPLTLWLTGQPAADGFRPLSEPDRELWRSQLRQLGDPWLRVEILAPQNV